MLSPEIKCGRKHWLFPLEGYIIVRETDMSIIITMFCDTHRGIQSKQGGKEEEQEEATRRGGRPHKCGPRSKPI